MWKDPIVEEVRAARAEIAKECNYDFAKARERSRELVKRWHGKVLTLDDMQTRPTPTKRDV
jgi:hypothetical protein